MEKLTDRQKTVFEFIEAHFAEYGRPPTIREIASNFGITIGPVQKYLKILVNKGFLRQKAGLSRGIELVLRKPLAAVPVLGVIRAGVPEHPAENAEGYVYVDRGIVKKAGYFALRVRGDSMTGSGIMENDIVVVRPQETANDGEIVVAMVDGEAAVKKLRRKGADTYLESTNPAYKPIRGKEINIVGRVIYLERKI